MMYSSTLDHQEHDYNPSAQKGTPENPWFREDVESGLLQKSLEASRAAQKKEEELFQAGLSEEGSMSRILEHGSNSEKIKAFEYLARKEQVEPIAEVQDTDSKEKTNTRIPFKSKLIG